MNFVGQKRTQEDHVREELGVQEPTRVVRKTPPGIKQLHTLPITEVAEVLATVLKSEKGVVSVTYKVGEYIELEVLNS